jgi:CRP/FNR family cyclic AMP-dependent transcriptional regulator
MSLPTEKNESFASCEFQDNLDILRQIDFFSGLSMESLKVLAYVCLRENFKPGDYLFRQGEDDGQALYIVSGRAELVHEDEDGSEVIREFGAGDFLGGLALLGQTPRLFSLRASENLTGLIIEREKFVSVMQQFPDQLGRVVRAFVDGVMSWEERFLVSRSKGCEACRHKIGVSMV